MNIITGYTSATSGSVKVDGLDNLKEPRTVKAKIGYLPEFPPLYGEMTVKEYLGFVGDIKSVSKAEKDECFEKIVDLVKISDVWDRLIKNLSKGYKQRIGLAQALIGNPQILILDEPTVGLDPKQIIEIRNLIKELSKEHTIILSSHILTEVSAVCERVIIINKGKIVAGDTPENLGKSLSASSKLALRVAGPKDQVINILSKLTGVKELLAQGVKEPNTIDILITAEGDIDLRRPIFSTLSQANYPILMMRSLDLTLEDIFLHVTTEEEPIEEVS